MTRSNTDTGSAIVVNLQSGDTTEATVPATVVIPAGQSQASFPITAVDDALLDGTQTVTITASAVGVYQRQQVAERNRCGDTQRDRKPKYDE